MTYQIDTDCPTCKGTGVSSRSTTGEQGECTGEWDEACQDCESALALIRMATETTPELLRSIAAWANNLDGEQAVRLRNIVESRGMSWGAPANPPGAYRRNPIDVTTQALRVALASPQPSPEAWQSGYRLRLLEDAARLLRNHVAGENVDDLMHYWADKWDLYPAQPSQPPSLGGAAWVRVEDGLPPSNQLVQFAVAHIGGPCVGYRGADCGKGHEWQDYTDQDACGDCATYSDEQVTHWAPLLPPPPKPEEGT